MRAYWSSSARRFARFGTRRAGLRQLRHEEHALTTQRLHLRLDVLDVALGAIHDVEVHLVELGQLAGVLLFEVGPAWPSSPATCWPRCAPASPAKNLASAAGLTLTIVAILREECIDQPFRALLRTLRLVYCRKQR